VNTQINFANYQSMKEMTASLKEIIELLKIPVADEMNFRVPK
jgi:hypothetical protein